MRLTKEKAESGKLETYIGDGTKFEGILTSKDNITIYGSVKGAIECQGRVIVGDGGNIEADIIANDIIISGKVLGNVTAKEKLEISSTGSLKGDIKTSRLVMEDGSKFDGHSEMLSGGKPPVIENTPSISVSPAITTKEKPKLPSASRS